MIARNIRSLQERDFIVYRSRSDDLAASTKRAQPLIILKNRCAQSNTLHGYVGG